MQWIRLVPNLLINALKIIPYLFTWVLSARHQQEKSKDRAIKIKDQQLRVANNRPRTRNELLERLRKGGL